MFESTIHLDPSQRYLVALSGGRDSIALLHFLLEKGINKLLVCHLNHRLRGKESGQDAAFVRRLATRLKLPLELESIDVAKLAEKNSLSIETAARQARYDFFAKVARQHRTPRLLLAHHADDQAETVLYNLLRGSAGPRGMLAKSERRISGYQMTLLRPLLDTTRNEINEYIKNRKLKFREDSTNAEPIATRNRMRHEALPLLAEIMDRDITPALARAARYQHELDETLDALLDHLELYDPQGRLFLPKLQQLTPLLQRQALFQYLKSNGIKDIDRATLERCRDLLIPGGSHATTLSGGKQLRRKEARLFLA